ncbi:MAG: branched-chain amino acid ABC transporter permease [Firmicutes bacterium]|jgi:branched-chain amino acid transport system permease protein|nr:branched-chain amino acid ABC transporter permease [Bacillota bacterium]
MLGVGMQLFLQQIASGLGIGSIYGLIAVGYVMIFNSVGAFNFAQADIFMAGAFLSLVFYGILRLPFLVSFALVIVGNALLGVLLERVAFRRLLRRQSMNYMICTIGVGIVLRNAARLVFGTELFTLASPLSEDPLIIGGIVFVPQNLAILAATLILSLMILWFFHRTRIGMAMRAVAQDQEAARLMGINVGRSISWTYGISSGLAGAAAMLVAPLFFIGAEMGPSYGMKAFASFILGGATSIPGALTGGLLLGVIENLVGGYVSTTYKDAAAFLVLVIVLFLKPSGILVRGERR